MRERRWTEQSIPENMINGPVSILYTTLKKKKKRDGKKGRSCLVVIFFFELLIQFHCKMPQSSSYFQLRNELSLSLCPYP